MTQAIHAFLAERQDNWLKAKLKGITDETEIADIQQQASEKFSLAQWVPDAARRAGHLSIVSHLGKFTHPSAKTSAIIAHTRFLPDGYCRSGNLKYPLDAFGSAASMDVYKFLNLTLSNGQTLLHNLETENTLLKTLFSFPHADYVMLRQGFLSIKAEDTHPKTDHQVKQVYFPVAENTYHLLSILTPSGLLTEMKQRIDHLRFSEETKTAKERRRKNEWDDTGFDDLMDLTVTAFGGTKPQNISVLNNQNAGRAYLLPCFPPQLAKRQIRLPRNDFFTQTLYRAHFRNDFQSLHRCMEDNRNNHQIRQRASDAVSFIIDKVIGLAIFLRNHESAGWSDKDNRILSQAQKIWLDRAYAAEQETNSAWREHIAADLARWFIHAYAKTVHHSAFAIGDVELVAIKQVVQATLDNDKEYL